jgi:hypothetical protein
MGLYPSNINGIFCERVGFYAIGMNETPNRCWVLRYMAGTSRVRQEETDDGVASLFIYLK